MTAAECPLTELPPDQCACPKHRGGPTIEAVTIGAAFEAAYAGHCIRCDRQIRPRDTIARLADNDGYVHSGRCPR